MAQALAGRDQIIRSQRIGANVTAGCEHRMIAGQLDAHTAFTGVLRGLVGHLEDRTTGERRRMPPNDTTPDEIAHCIDTHDFAVVPRTDEPPDALPRAVAQLD